MPGALDRQSLANRVRSSDALAAAVACCTNAAHHRVDAIAGLLGVGQSLEDEQRRPFAHHEAVGTSVERPGASGGECADLAELDERRCAHVAIDAPRDRHIELAGGEAGDRSIERGQRGSAGGIDDEVGAVQVEEIGDAPGDAVAQLAGHRVLRECGRDAVHPTVQLRGDGGPKVEGQTGERGCIPELASDFREGDPKGSLIVPLAAHGVAEDDSGSLGVECAGWPAVVDERGVGASNRPLLGVVHGVADLGRDGEVPLEGCPVPVAHPTADLRVGPLGRLVVRVVVEVGIPSVPLCFADRVPALFEVVPERSDIGGVRQDGAHADDCNGQCGLAHDVLP